jgi:hypothetical protein
MASAQGDPAAHADGHVAAGDRGRRCRAFVGGLRPLDGGADGLYYQGAGRQIAQYLAAGDFAKALEGGEAVFYYGGPGLRYFRALEMFIFGDTNLGYLSLVLLLPVVAFALYRRFLPTRWALAPGSALRRGAAR